MAVEKYRQAFVEAFELENRQSWTNLNTMQLRSGLIGHMSLIAELEDAFDISMETDDIVDFSSFKHGVSIMAKYGVSISV